MGGNANSRRTFWKDATAELRMLFYVGKDVFRWIDQCVDTCGAISGIERSRDIGSQFFSFAD